VQFLEVKLGNRLQLRRQPRSFETSRARYSSCRLMSAAIAAAHLLGRGGTRGAGRFTPPDRLVHGDELWILDHVIGNAGP
jgi:hypothetical protein